MPVPTKPRTAGNSVIEASIVTTTASEAPMARPRTKLMPIANMPSSETTTMQPANTTALPDVTIERTTARSAGMPS